MDHQEGQIPAAAATLTWRRWLLGAFAGTVACIVTLVAIDLVLHPERGTGNTRIYASMLISLVAGTVAAGLTVKARSRKRWVAAFLLTLLSVATLGLIVIGPWVFFPSGP